jgi:hypothetical protein
VVGGRWVGFHRPTGGGLLRQTSGPLEHGPGVPDGHGTAEWRSACLWIAGLAGFRGTVLVEIV